MIVSTKKLLSIAQKNKFGIGAFNFNNMEMLQAIISAAEAERSPVIIQLTESALDYGGNYLCAMAKEAEKSKIPVALHLDHGRNLNTVHEAMDLGFSSIMYDGSALAFEENVANTKRIIRWARIRNISVEAEIGAIKYGGEKTLTDPWVASDFAEKTGCDFLAISIGTSHGAYKTKDAANLDFDRLKQIKKAVSVPLVLHGASSVPKELVNLANTNGAKLSGTGGVPDDQVKKAIKYGISKINNDTDLKLAFISRMREVLKKEPKQYDIRKILGPGRDEMVKIIRSKMRLFGCAGKAKLY